MTNIETHANTWIMTLEALAVMTADLVQADVFDDNVHSDEAGEVIRLAYDDEASLLNHVVRFVPRDMLTSFIQLVTECMAANEDD